MWPCIIRHICLVFSSLHVISIKLSVSSQTPRTNHSCDCSPSQTQLLWHLICDLCTPSSLANTFLLHLSVFFSSPTPPLNYLTSSRSQSDADIWGRLPPGVVVSAVAAVEPVVRSPGRPWWRQQQQQQHAPGLCSSTAAAHGVITEEKEVRRRPARPWR